MCLLKHDRFHKRSHPLYVKLHSNVPLKLNEMLLCAATVASFFLSFFAVWWWWWDAVFASAIRTNIQSGTATHESSDWTTHALEHWAPPYSWCAVRWRDLILYIKTKRYAGCFCKWKGIVRLLPLYLCVSDCLCVMCNSIENANNCNYLFYSIFLRKCLRSCNGSGVNQPKKVFFLNPLL